MKTIMFFMISVLVACGSDAAKKSGTVATDAAGTPAPSIQAEPGPEGPQGPKGDKGDPGKDGAPAAVAKPGTDGTDGTDGTAGANGTSGTNGTNGTAGAVGAVGARGPAGELALLNASGTQVGLLVDAGSNMVLLLDGGFFYTGLNTGNYYGTLGFPNTTSEGSVFPTCAFTTTDCSGTCYLTNATMGDDLVPVVNSVVWDGHKLWRYSGDEVQNPGVLAAHSHWKMDSQPLNTCVTANSSLNMAWPLSHEETLPTGVTFPFGKLHFAPL